MHLILLKGSIATAFRVGIVGGAGDPISLIVDFFLNTSASSTDVWVGPYRMEERSIQYFLLDVPENI